MSNPRNTSRNTPVGSIRNKNLNLNLNRNRLVVFSGGSAANSIVDVFNGLLHTTPTPITTPAPTIGSVSTAGSRGKLTGLGGNGFQVKLQQLSYIIGISDNGGSTSEILRVFGGPGIGDVRSRLIRLVPDPLSTSDDQASEIDYETSAKVAIKHLLNYRLPASETLAKTEWLDIVEGSHQNWTRIPSDKRELLRSFLVHLHSEILKRARPPTSTFNFHSASIGNLFLTSTRLFFGSFESAIYLFRSITGVPENIQVVPAINSMFAHHIAAGLIDGTVIVGQNEISHPSDAKARKLLPSSENIYSTAPSGAATPITPFGALAFTPHYGQHRLHPLNSWPTPVLAGAIGGTGEGSDEGEEEKEEEEEEEEEEDSDVDSNDGVEDANLPGSHPSLKSRNIIFEKENEPELPSRIDRVWYINPYGQEIRPPANPKVLTALNEAGAVVFSIGSLYTSIIPCLILRGIGHALSSPLIPFKILILNGSLDRETGPSMGHPSQDFSASDFIRAIVRACIDSQSRNKLKTSGSLSPIPPPSTPLPTAPYSAVYTGSNTPQGGAGVGMFIPPSEYVKYVTHVVYLEGKGAPRVDLDILKGWGIKAVKVEGKAGKKGGVLYDVGRLREALEGIIYY